jgi:hypothetical protein
MSREWKRLSLLCLDLAFLVVDVGLTGSDPHGLYAVELIHDLVRGVPGPGSPHWP